MYKKMIACAGCLAVTAAASAQYISGFELIDATASGVPLTGQEDFYVPDGGTSTDVLAYSYADNALGLPANPEGGETFIAGSGPGGGTFARAQRDFAFTGLLKRLTFDFAVPSFGGTLPASDYIGSFSFQPSTSAQFIALLSWMDLAVADSYRLSFVVFDDAGTQAPLPGLVAGPAFENLQPDTWYRVEIVAEWRERRIRKVQISEVGADPVAETPDGWFLNGGALGTNPLPEAFRFFGGGAQAGNAVAFDNMTLTCYVDCNGDDRRDVFDFLCFQNAFDQGDPYADCDADGQLTLFDFLCFQNAFVCD